MPDKFIVLPIVLLFVSTLFRACFLRSSDDILEEQQGANTGKRAGLVVVTLALLSILMWNVFWPNFSLMAWILCAIIAYEGVVGTLGILRPDAVYRAGKNNPHLVKVPLGCELTYFAVLLFSLLGPMGVSLAGDDSYLSLSVGAEEYELEHIRLGCFSINAEGDHLIEFGSDIFKTEYDETPLASIQWRMHLERPEELLGRTVDLTTDAQGPLLVFGLTPTISVLSEAELPQLRIEFSPVGADGYVEGTFTGENMIYSSEDEAAVETVTISGKFRAKWESD